jgi:ribose 5-phosphate isomerase B
MAAEDELTAKVREIVRRIVAEESPPSAPTSAPVIALGADHGGLALKQDLRNFLLEQKYNVTDCGTFSPDPVDYPDIAYAVAKLVSDGAAWRGIIVDGAGIGSAMVANKVPGIRAALCYDLTTARNAREHNDANVLTLGGRLIGVGLARDIVKVFLETECAEERHKKRVAKIMDVEKRYLRK